MKKILNQNKAITLIALVITIVVLIILVSVLISITLGNNGLFSKAKLEKQRYEYASAKEIIDLKLLEIQTECLSTGEEYSVTYVKNILKEDEIKNIEIVYYYETISKKSDELEIPASVQGIVVIATEHPMYEFLIGQKTDGKAGIIGVKLTSENEPSASDFTSTYTFENTNLKSIIDTGGQSPTGPQEITAEMISYTPNEDLEWDGISNVKQALDSLFEMYGGEDGTNE